LRIGDIRDIDALHRALQRVHIVVNLVALVRVGQSMDQIDEYTSVDNFGTSVLLQHLSTKPVGRLAGSSSMSI
jgi:dTDP-L-rhamnose 4-epimerase